MPEYVAIVKVLADFPDKIMYTSNLEEAKCFVEDWKNNHFYADHAIYQIMKEE